MKITDRGSTHSAANQDVGSKKAQTDLSKQAIFEKLLRNELLLKNKQGGQQDEVDADKLEGKDQTYYGQSLADEDAVVSTDKRGQAEEKEAWSGMADDQETQLLAVSKNELAWVGGIPSPASSQSSAIHHPAEASYQGAYQEAVDLVTQHINSAIRSGAIASDGSPMTFSMQLGEDISFAGIKGLSFVMTGDSLDITLIGGVNQATASGQLASAAQILADRLQMRVGGRLVRVMATRGSEGVSPSKVGNSMDSISDLFGSGHQNTGDGKGETR